MIGLTREEYFDLVADHDSPSYKLYLQKRRFKEEMLRKQLEKKISDSVEVSIYSFIEDQIDNILMNGFMK